MDYQFPRQLFPSFYDCGPPDSVLKHCAGSWGSYDGVRPQGSSGPLSSWTFTSRHQVRGETWRHAEPVPVPLLPPKNSVLWPWTPPNPLDFTEHMQNFFMDHCQDAFGCMSEILGESFYFKEGPRQRYRKGSVNMWRVKNILNLLKYKICHQSYSSRSLDAYSFLLSDVVHAVPPQLLGSLLYEELSEQRDRLLFSEGSTGGALAFVPFSQGGSGSQHGCLLYPGNKGLNSLNFHRVELQQQRGSCPRMDASSSNPFSFQLKGPVRQISSAALLNDCCVAVRSDRLCGAWRFSERSEPRLLQVINTREVATCVGASPHVLGEILVASESGAANLWTVGRGMQKVREEDHNLYFNAKSSWRWCEFSAHPRVMLYADRTGVELTDIRVNPAVCHTLFRVSNTSKCRRGERLILSRYLGDAHCFHHLVTTQYSAYIMDERFSGVPMLKCDHMMQSPPIFCHIVPGSASSGSAVGEAGATKILLGSHLSQEITLLQYSGGRAEACFSRGPPQALLRPRDSLKHLPVQIPHRQDIATERLSSPAAGLTCIQKQEGREAGGEECICVLQLTEAGDIFYQVLEPEPLDTRRPPAAQDDPQPEQSAKKLPQPTLNAATSGLESAKWLQDSQLVVSDTSSSEDIIEPTQVPSAQRFVAETPEREQQALNMDSDAFSEDSESGARKRWYRRQLLLQVVINDDPAPDPASGLKDEGAAKNIIHSAEEPGGVEETVNSSSGSAPVGPPERQTPVKLSQSALVTWKHWLQRLMRKSRDKKPRPRHLQHLRIETEGLLPLSGDAARDPAEEARARSLRRELSTCMAKRSLLVHSAVTASLGALDVVPVPNPVDAGAWTDQLSHRLTLSWQGEEAWQAWWEDRLGLNREEKVEALKRKRRSEKVARRASGRRLELSASFTSSVSYQSELDDFSISTGWSSAASQGALSDAEGANPQGVLELKASQEGMPFTVEPDTPVQMPVQTGTPQSVQDTQSDQQAPSSSCTPSLSYSPKWALTQASQRGAKRPADDYLISPLASQGEHSQPDSHFLEEETAHTPLPPMASSQFFTPRRVLRVDLSKDPPIQQGFSQSLSLSQSSQGRLGLSQASQPKKRKSRMGF